MALALTIAAVNRTTYLLKGSLRIEWTAAGRSSADLTLIDRTKTSPFTPDVDDEVAVSVQGTTRFGGVITRRQVRYRSKGRGRRITVSCRDYSIFAEWRTAINASFASGSTTHQILESLVGDLSQYGVTWDNSIATGAAWAPVTFDGRTYASIFDDLCAAEGWYWYIDTGKVFRAGALTQSAPANLTQSITTNGGVVHAEWAQDRDDYANHITLRLGPDGPLDKTETGAGTGATRYFYFVHTPLGIPATVGVNRDSGGWVENTVAPYNSGGSSKWWYCTPTNNPGGSWDTSKYGLYHDSGDTPILDSGDLWRATFSVQFPITVTSETAEAATRKRMKLYVAPDVTDKTAGQALADAYKTKHSAAPKVATVRTRVHGFLPGQAPTIYFDDLGLASETYYIRTVQGQVRSAVRDAVSTQYLDYTIEAVAAGALPPTWRDWFASLASGGSSASVVTGSGGTSGLIVQGQGRVYLGGSRTIGQRIDSGSGDGYADLTEYVDVILDSTKLPAALLLNVHCWVPLGTGQTVTPRLVAGSGDWTNRSTVGQGVAVSATTPSWQQIVVTPRAGTWAYRVRLTASSSAVDVFCAGAVLEW